jgi:patatin-like phospholipase/acyl hydrolase
MDHRVFPAPPPIDAPYRILSLDGGGAKGFYTLGVLKEIERLSADPCMSNLT